MATISNQTTLNQHTSRVTGGMLTPKAAWSMPGTTGGLSASAELAPNVRSQLPIAVAWFCIATISRKTNQQHTLATLILARKQPQTVFVMAMQSHDHGTRQKKHREKPGGCLVDILANSVFRSEDQIEHRGS